MLWIGLTGGIATGKSTVSRLLRERGFVVVDADILSREAIEKGSQGFSQVVRKFGAELLTPEGDIDRKKLGTVVFADRAKLAALEDIVHPRVRALAAEKRAALEAQGNFAAFYDVPLLFEKKMEAFFDRVVVVACRPEIQRQRLVSRDGFTPEEADRRLSAQIPIDEKVKLAPFVIRNDADLGALEANVDTFLKNLK